MYILLHLSHIAKYEVDVNENSHLVFLNMWQHFFDYYLSPHIHWIMLGPICRIRNKSESFLTKNIKYPRIQFSVLWSSFHYPRKERTTTTTTMNFIEDFDRKTHWLRAAEESFFFCLLLFSYESLCLSGRTNTRNLVYNCWEWLNFLMWKSYSMTVTVFRLLNWYLILLDADVWDERRDFSTFVISSLQIDM